jgi:hypothetical protein
MTEQEAKPFDRYLIKCRFCSCVFFTVYDLDCHMAAFGYDKDEHLYNFDRKRFVGSGYRRYENKNE